MRIESIVCPQHIEEKLKNYEIQTEDELRDEYDFTRLQVVARGPERKQPKQITVELAPDVAAMFPDSVAVNEAF